MALKNFIERGNRFVDSSFSKNIKYKVAFGFQYIEKHYQPVFRVEMYKDGCLMRGYINGIPYYSFVGDDFINISKAMQELGKDYENIKDLHSGKSTVFEELK